MTQLRSTGISRIIRAPRDTIYQAFIDAEAVARWLPPGNMTGIVHAFDAREGGAFNMSLVYPENEAGQGKSDARTDTFKGRFVELVPNERVAWSVQFDSADPAFAGEMIVTAMLVPFEDGTKITMRCDHIPYGIRLEDNEEGTRLSLDQLARLVGG